MTIADNATRNQYTATASQTVFAYNFEIFDEDDIRVYRNSVLLVKTTDYTVSGVGNENGGSITLTSGATANDIYTLFRDMSANRLSDYQTSGDFLASDLNTDFDRIWAAIQQNESARDADSLVFSEFEERLVADNVLPSPVASTYWRWDSNAKKVEFIDASTLTSALSLALDAAVSSASTSETNAATSATNAATSASGASTSETNAAASASAAAASAATANPDDAVVFRKSKPSDSLLTSQANFLSDPHLASWALDADSSYHFKLYLDFNMPLNSAGTKWRLEFSSTPQYSRALITAGDSSSGKNNGDIGYTDPYNVNSLDAVGGFDFSVTATVDAVVVIEAVLKSNASTGGALALQLAQIDTTFPSITTFREGSFGILTKL